MQVIYNSSFIGVSQIKCRSTLEQPLKYQVLLSYIGFESLVSHKRDWFNQSALSKHFPELLKLYNTCRDLSKCVEKRNNFISSERQVRFESWQVLAGTLREVHASILIKVAREQDLQSSTQACHLNIILY